MAQRGKLTGVYLSEAAEARLSELAEATKRTRSVVVELLLRQARLSPQPDIELAPCEAIDGAQR